jgi:DNA (cytosine-5)-methyltransferase 1
MAISYNRLWKLLIDKKMKRVELRDAAQISTNVLARLGHDEPVSMVSMEKICRTLDCNIGDVMEFSYSREEGIK